MMYECALWLTMFVGQSAIFFPAPEHHHPNAGERYAHNTPHHSTAASP
jgi:hypothetical protein